MVISRTDPRYYWRAWGAPGVGELTGSGFAAVDEAMSLPTRVLLQRDDVTFPAR